MHAAIICPMHSIHNKIQVEKVGVKQNWNRKQPQGD
jgi:hypothetical protein